VECIKNRRVYDDKFFSHLLGIKVYQFPWILIPGDIIKNKKRVLIVGGY
jgi:hypothetical protein